MTTTLTRRTDSAAAVTRAEELGLAVTRAEELGLAVQPMAESIPGKEVAAVKGLAEGRRAAFSATAGARGKWAVAAEAAARPTMSEAAEAGRLAAQPAPELQAGKTLLPEAAQAAQAATIRSA